MSRCGVGFPFLRVGAKTEAGKVRLTLTVEQSAPAYALRLPLKIVIAGRAEMRSIDVTGPRDVVTMLVDTMTEGVRLDPELRVWRVLDRTQLPPILRQWVIGRAPRWVQASGAGDVREAATALAERFFEAPPQPTAQDALHKGTAPVMLIGLHGDVDRALAHAGLPLPRRARPNAAAHRYGRSRATQDRRWPWSRPGMLKPCRHCSPRCRTTARRAGSCSMAGARSTAACGQRQGPSSPCRASVDDR